MKEIFLNLKDPNVNGEKAFFDHIQADTNTIFDIGSKENSILSNFGGEVHYFNPLEGELGRLKDKISNSNQSFFINDYALGSSTLKKDLFIEEKNFFGTFNPAESSTRSALMKDSRSYILDLEDGKKKKIDLLKIKARGGELDVIQGFKEYIKNIKLIQFNYSPYYIKRGVKLNDLITYLKSKSFVDFSYLSTSGYIPFEKLKGTRIKVNPLIGNGGTIEAFQGEQINDHYNYCNIICRKL